VAPPGLQHTALSLLVRARWKGCRQRATEP